MTAVGRDFESGDTVLITANNYCNMRFGLSVSHIPVATDAQDFNQYVYLTENGVFYSFIIHIFDYFILFLIVLLIIINVGTDLYFAMQVQQDCDMFTINITRIPPIIDIHLGINNNYSFAFSFFILFFIFYFFFSFSFHSNLMIGIRGANHISEHVVGTDFFNKNTRTHRGHSNGCLWSSRF